MDAGEIYSEADSLAQVLVKNQRRFKTALSPRCVPPDGLLWYSKAETTDQKNQCSASLLKSRGP